MSRWWYYQSEQQQQSWMSQHHQQQFSFVMSDVVAILNASLSWDTDTYQFGPITAVGVTNINPIRLCVSANWPLPRCVRDHKVYVDDSCCWYCCPILTPFDPFEALDVSSSALLSTARVAVIMPSAASVSFLVSVLILWSWSERLFTLSDNVKCLLSHQGSSYKRVEF